jgi:serine/threonine-protein kinase RsbW
MTDIPPFGSPAEPSLGTLGFPIDVRIPSDVRYIEHVVDVVVQRCHEQALPSHACRLNVPVALTEALSNAILYGNRRDTSKAVRLRASMDERGLVMEVSDEGSGFDLDGCTSDPTARENIVREDGRGLFLMRSLMDQVEQYVGEGNVVRLTLHRA